MKYITLSIFWLTFLTSGLGQENDFQMIDALLDQQIEAWNVGDIEAFMEGYWPGDSLTMMGSSGVKYGFNNILQGYKRGYPDEQAMGRLDFSILDRKKIDENAILYLGKFIIDRKSEEGDFGYFTLVFSRMNGSWKIVHDHTSAGSSKK